MIGLRGRVRTIGGRNVVHDPPLGHFLVLLRHAIILRQPSALAKAEQLELFGRRAIRDKPDNYLGVDRSGRVHWRSKESEARREQRRQRLEERQGARRERFENRAAKLEAESAGRHHAADQISERFWMGQPIIVGHHSEKRARRDQERMHNNMRRAIDADQGAAAARAAADSVGRAGISAEDPDAPEKLQSKVQKLERLREELKALNKEWRKRKGGSLDAAGKKALAVELLKDKPHLARHAKVPEYEFERNRLVPDYILTNLGGRIRQAKQREDSIKTEEKRRDAEGWDETVLHRGAGWTITADPEDERIRLEFESHEKNPDRHQTLRGYGWNWSPKRKAYVRPLNQRGRAFAQVTADLLNER